MGFWLTPEHGAPVEVETTTWASTVELLESRSALDGETLARMRTDWDTHVSAEDAVTIAEAVDAFLHDPSPAELILRDGRNGARGSFRFDVEDPDRNRRIALSWLTQFRDFARRSGGFAIGWPAVPRVVPADGPEGVGAAATASGGAARGARSGWERRLRALLGPFALLLILGVKWIAKIKVVLLFIAKLKFAGTAISGVVSIGAYALLFGLPFAALFVLLLFVHEMGHVIALRREGIPATAPMFIPFLGAVVGMKALPDDAWAEAKVGLAGPLLGSIGAAVTLGIGVALDSDLLHAAAYTAFFLNLFNLLPITPLDGGRAAAALHPAFWLLGLAAMVGLFFVMPNVILVLIAVIGALDAWRRFKEYRRGGEAQRRYYSVTPLRRLAVAGMFLGLIAFTVLGMRASFIEV